jgi:adhesin transport system outer membrane protein
LHHTVIFQRKVTLLLSSVVIASSIVACFSTKLQAEPLSELIPLFLGNHNQIKAAKSDVVAAKQTAVAAKGGWYPSLSSTFTYGNEQQQKPGDTGADSNMVSRQATITLTQRLWDGGETSSAVRTAKLSQLQSEEILKTTKSSLLLRAFTAYMNVIRAAEGLNYAKRSEINIKKQTELEDALVKRGAGFSTDVLQAKVQFSGAQARRVRAEGGLAIATNAYRGVFLKNPGSIDSMTKPRLPADLIPATVEEAVSNALKNNAFLAANNLTSQIAMEAVKAARAREYMPTVDGIVDFNHKRDVGSTRGTQEEIFSKVQVSFPFNLGFTAINTLKATSEVQNAASYRYADAKSSIEEATRNAWEQLKTAKLNAVMLKNQANIASEFLVFARKERKLGRRSLLDVLGGETALINSSSDSASANIDISIASMTLLDAMGELNEAALSR